LPASKKASKNSGQNWTVCCTVQLLGIFGRVKARRMMMDNRVRKNEICIVNLPSCDYVFSASPSCFIGYGFNRSKLEVDILKDLLKDRRIEAHEAGGTLAPAQHVFCQKICSKIIQSQFCIVLLNNENVGKIKKANANVHMEYGLMLGFNKYILPFQHEDYSLEFNVAGLDTIKYNNNSFKPMAADAIDQAILQTTQKSPSATLIGPDVGAYLLLHGAIIAPLDNPIDKTLYQIGSLCGFNNLCLDFTGNRYIYFGNFPKLQPSVIVWRTKKLLEILEQRFVGLEFRVKRGVLTQQQMDLLVEVYRTMEIWILANNAEDREAVLKLLDGCTATVTAFTVADVSEEVSKSEMY
jgi:hypothetical protein